MGLFFPYTTFGAILRYGVSEVGEDLGWRLGIIGEVR